MSLCECMGSSAVSFDDDKIMTVPRSRSACAWVGGPTRMPIINAVDRVGGASRPQGLLRSPSGEATERMLKQLSKLRPEVRRRIYQQPNPSQRWPRLGLAKLLNSPYNEVLAVAGAGSEFCDCQPVPAIRKKKPEGRNVVQPRLGNGSNSSIGDARFYRPAAANGWPQGCRASLGGKRERSLP
jgi:hypothetical protein